MKKKKSILKTILMIVIKSIALALFIFSIGILHVQQYYLRNNLTKSINGIQTQINELYDQTSKLITGQWSLMGNIDKNTTDINRKLKTINVRHILHGSVIVNVFWGTGSGTIIKKTDNTMYVLTCHHVIDDIIKLNESGFSLGATVGYMKLDAEYNKVGVIMYVAEIIKYDEDNDLALLKIKTADVNLNVIEIAETEPKKGDTVYTVGNPLSSVRTISKGILANTEVGFYVFDGTITYGNSGGGLFNLDGELIGVPARVPLYGSTKLGIYVPESGLGRCINLLVIKNFLKGVDY